MHGSRTRLKQELEKQKLEADRRREEMERRREEMELQKQREMRELMQSQAMSIPSQQQPSPAPNGGPQVEVPHTILEVRTQLQNPTSYHITALRETQLKQFLSSSQGVPVQVHSAPAQHYRPMNVHQTDPLLSNTMSSSPHKAAMSHVPVPFHGPASVPVKSESPTMMITDSTDDQLQEQLIEDIMSLEEKFGDNIPPFIDAGGLHVPQTLPMATNMFDMFGSSSVGGAMSTPISASCPAAMKEDDPVFTMKQFEKERQKKNNHNLIERRRRFNINDRIKELGTLLPTAELNDSRQNKGTILKASVDYIKKLQRDANKAKMFEAKQRQLEESNRQMRMRIQELELTARAHGIATPSLNPETQKLAEVAEQVLGSVTPRTKSPIAVGATSTEPRPFSGDLSTELSEVLRSSPGIDLSRLHIKQERPETPTHSTSVSTDLLSPAPGSTLHMGTTPLSATSNGEDSMSDVFSFNVQYASQSEYSVPSPANTNSSDTLFSDS
ncbi:hypothetical protein EMCRGX_G026957 [Ephydatia muelleri]|eukprot:Em0014g28a